MLSLRSSPIAHDLAVSPALWTALKVGLAATVVIVLGFVTVAALRSRYTDAMADFPPTMLWAWERPEKLLFVNPQTTGVAFLARTLYLRDGSVFIRPRFQPLRVPPGTKLIAVVHAESDWRHSSSLTAEQRGKAADAIIDLEHLPGIGGIQIDFDARQSERRFYQELLRDVRGRLDQRVKLSMTALASWCLYDDWLAHLPVDEIVPMLFRMGVDQRRVTDYLDRHKDFRSERCQSSVGISVDEPVSRLPSRSRVYIFNPKLWSESDFQGVLREITR